MSSALPPPEERFHKNVIALAQLIHDVVSSVYEKGYNIVNPNLIGLVSGFLSGYDKTKLIQNFIKYSYIHWDQIHVRDTHFFEKNAMEIFRDLPLNNVDAFKMLYSLRDDKGDYVISLEDQEAIWEFFESFVKISIKYIHQNRRPAIKTDKQGNKKRVYTAHFYDEVPIERHAQLWQVDLEFVKA